MNMKTNGSNVWPYVVVGSAIGGAIGYLFMSESGRKIRRSVTHPDELADSVDEARQFVEQKAQVITDQVHGLLGKARLGIEEGQLAYRQAQQDYHAKFQRIETKSNQVAADVHRSIDNITRSAVSIEKSVLDPIAEMGALYRGIERGIRSIFGKTRSQTSPHGAIPIYRDTRIMGG